MNTLDAGLSALDHALRTVFGVSHAARPNPAARMAAGAEPLADSERKLSGALMRVNHVGEVCAQALYEAQALTARTPELRRQMREAAAEETDHLAWTRERLAELGSRPSLLNPLWYAGSFAIGLVAGRLGDAASLGFVVETERQVEQHLAGHLQRQQPAAPQATATHRIAAPAPFGLQRGPRAGAGALAEEAFHPQGRHLGHVGLQLQLMCTGGALQRQGQGLQALAVPL